MVAWKRAVFSGERKAVARYRFQPERTQATSKALIRRSQKGRRGAEELPPVIRLQSSEPCMPASGQAELDDRLIGCIDLAESRRGHHFDR